MYKKWDVDLIQASTILIINADKAEYLSAWNFRFRLLDFEVWLYHLLVIAWLSHKLSAPLFSHLWARWRVKVKIILTAEICYEDLQG